PEALRCGAIRNVSVISIRAARLLRWIEWMAARAAASSPLIEGEAMRRRTISLVNTPPPPDQREKFSRTTAANFDLDSASASARATTGKQATSASSETARGDIAGVLEERVGGIRWS